MAKRRLEGKGKAPDKIPSGEEKAPIDNVPRCQEFKNLDQCVRNAGHKGEHMANVQDFIVTWETK